MLRSLYSEAEISKYEFIEDSWNDSSLVLTERPYVSA